MTTKGSRIKKVRETLQMTQQQFADILGGVTRGAVGNWERNQGIKEENIELVSEKTGVSYEWLATGRGQMDPNGDVETTAIRSSSFARIPDLSIFGGMGGGGLVSALKREDVFFGDDTLRGYWTFPDYIARGLGPLNAIYAWEVRGDSMEPTLRGGSVVFVDTTQNTLPPDDLYAIDYGDGLMVKRIKLIPRSGKLAIISDNEKYGVDELGRDQVAIYGRIVGHFQWRG
ncbi:helix-turn-helix transcriptional regulator [Brucellaceae bacterium D45D]